MANCSGCEFQQPEIATENLEVFELWQLVETQWRSAGMGGVLGLDMPAVFAIAKIHGIAVTPIIYRKIRILERATLERMQAEMKKETK